MGLSMTAMKPSKEPRRARARRRACRENPFSPATCTSGKSRLSLQVWDLSALGGQILGTGGCSPWKKGRGPFFHMQSAAMELSMTAIGFLLERDLREKDHPTSTRLFS